MSSGIKNSEIHSCECKTRTFYCYIMCLRKHEQNFLDLLLDCKMKLQHFTAMASVLRILVVLRVMFRVYVYSLGSDTYTCNRTEGLSISQ